MSITTVTIKKQEAEKMLASELVSLFGKGKERQIFEIVRTMNPLMAEYGFDTVRRLRYFLAQIGHESAGLRYTREIGSGAAYDTGRKARMLGNTPEKDGDGQRYKGRGYIQITGKANYTALAKDLKIDCVNHPELLERPKFAILSALWFWKRNNLNIYADKDAYTALTKRINGGTNGMADRLAWLKKANSCISEV